MRVLVALPLTTALLILAPTSGAIADTTVLKTMVEGQSVVARSFDDIDGCTETLTQVAGGADRVQYISLTTNTCTGVVAGVVGEAAPTVFEASPSSKSAHVVAQFALVDVFTGAEVGTETVDLTWTATGKAVRLSGPASTQRSPGLLVVSHGDAVSSPAAATGTIGARTVEFQEAHITLSGFQILEVRQL